MGLDLGGAYCDECVFWEEEHAELGQCRISPPTVRWNRFMERYEGVWPLTKNDDWCGKFRKSAAAETIAAMEAIAETADR